MKFAAFKDAYLNKLLSLSLPFLHRPTAEEISAIKNTLLFRDMDEMSFTQITKSIQKVNYSADKLIITEGSKGKYFYFVNSGSLNVFTVNKHGVKIYLARLEKGSYFGEQALLGDVEKVRNASIETATPASLLRIKGKILKKIITKNNQLKALLMHKGHQESVHKLIASIPSYSDIKAIMLDNLHWVETYEKDTDLFFVGDKSDAVYFVLEGSVRLALPSGEHIKEVILGPGNAFGELGVLQNTTRLATATVLAPAKILRMQSEVFKSSCQNSPEFMNLVKSIKDIYTLPHRGVVIQHLGMLDNVTAITTNYKLDRREIIATKTVDGTFFMLEKINKNLENIKHQRKDGSSIVISIFDNKIKYVKCIGEWRYLKNVCGYLLDQKTLTDDLKTSFQNNGIFNPTDLQSNDTLCVCMSVPSDTILGLIEEGVNTFEAISKQTGACTVCGSCRPRLLAMLGQNVWLPAVLKKLRYHNDTIMSLEVSCSEDEFNSYLPGMHIVIQLKIEGIWVERAYTISQRLSSKSLEITIKKEQEGIFTNWVFQHVKDDKPIHVFVCQPQGEFKLLPEETSPIVCFAGGIGITPFIAFARELHSKNKLRPMHILYMVPDSSSAVYLSEFAEMGKEMPHFKLTLWERNHSGYLTGELVQQLVQDYQNPKLYICGPSRLETGLFDILKQLNYPTNSIHIERFSYGCDSQKKAN